MATNPTQGVLDTPDPMTAGYTQAELARADLAILRMKQEGEWPLMAGSLRRVNPDGSAAAFDAPFL